MSTRLEAGKRLRRLLAVLTWLARVKQAPVAELARRFSMTPEELVADLELAACCGLPPYTPDQLMEIVVDENEVVANLGEELARPRRLTAAEGFALVAAGRAILDSAGTPGDDSGSGGALARALGKLEAALEAAPGLSGDEEADRDAGGPEDGGALRVELGESAHLGEVRRALDQGRQLEVRYYSLSSDEESQRVIDPLGLVAVDGRWYLDAYCHKASGMRRFRVDRLVSLAETGAAVDHRLAPPAAPDVADAGEAPAAPAAFVPGPDATVATLAVDPEGMWVVEAVPALSVEPGRPGRSEVKLAVASRVWFERLLLRLGPHAEVLGPPELTGAGRGAARRLLERYEGSG